MAEEKLTEADRADTRHAALDIIGRLLSHKRYLRIASEGQVSVQDGKLVADAPMQFDIREFMDNDPHSKEARPIQRDAQIRFIDHAVAAGMLTLTDLGEGPMRYRMTLNRSVAGRILAEC